MIDWLISDGYQDQIIYEIKHFVRIIHLEYGTFIMTSEVRNILLLLTEFSLGVFNLKKPQPKPLLTINPLFLLRCSRCGPIDIRITTQVISSKFVGGNLGLQADFSGYG